VLVRREGSGKGLAHTRANAGGEWDHAATGREGSRNSLLQQRDVSHMQLHRLSTETEVATSQTPLLSQAAFPGSALFCSHTGGE